MFLTEFELIFTCHALNTAPKGSIGGLKVLLTRWTVKTNHKLNYSLEEGYLPSWERCLPGQGLASPWWEYEGQCSLVCEALDKILSSLVASTSLCFVKLSFD